MPALKRTTRWVKAHPAETAALAVGTATLAWIFWPRDKPFWVLAPPPKQTLPASKGPRVPGNSPRAKEANAVVAAIEALPLGGPSIVHEGPYKYEVTLSGPFTVLAQASRDNWRSGGNDDYATPKTFTNMKDAKAFAIQQVVIRRSAFALNNWGGCWRSLGICGPSYKPLCDGKQLPYGFTEVTNGLEYIRITGTEKWRYVAPNGLKGPAETNRTTLLKHEFKVSLPTGFVEGPATDRTGICGNPAVCGTSAKRCAWLKQDFEIWDALGITPYKVR